jgi:hypothetical protein
VKNMAQRFEDRGVCKGKRNIILTNPTPEPFKNKKVQVIVEEMDEEQ